MEHEILTRFPGQVAALAPAGVSLAKASLLGLGRQASWHLGGAMAAPAGRDGAVYLAVLGFVAVVAVVGTAIVARRRFARGADRLFAAARRLGADSEGGPPVTGPADRPSSRRPLRRRFDDAAAALERAAARCEAAEAEMRDGHGLLRAVVELVGGGGDVVFVKDRGGRYLFLNAAAAALIGRQPGEVVGRDDYQFFPPETADAIGEVDRDVMAGGVHRTYEESLPLDGARREFVTTKAPYRDRNGDVVGVLGVSRDVTDRRRAEQALRESEERLSRLNQDLRRRVAEFQTLLEVLPVGIAIARDPACERIDVNPFFARLLGVPRGSNASLTAPPAERPTHFTVWADGGPLAAEELPLQTAARDGTVIRNREVQVRLSDGRVLDLLEFAVPLRDESGRPWGSVGVFVDLTERRRAEDAARKQQAELAHLSRLVTMGEMASGLAHELNQPLGAILNYAVAAAALVEDCGSGGVMETSSLLPRVLATLHEIERETKRAGEIISRLRSFVRKQAPRRAPVGVADLIDEATRIMGAEVRLQSVHFRVDATDRLPKVMADGVQIEQVLVNLIRNAVEAMAATDPSRRRLVIRAVAGLGTVRVSVLDAGPGIAPDQVGRIFDSFFTTKADGLGVGLTLSRSIVESHGGRLTCEPNPGGGTAFHFTLPFAPPAGPPVATTPDDRREIHDS